MYPLTNLDIRLNKETIDKIGRPFTKVLTMYPLTNLDTPLNKETIDTIGKPFTKTTPCTIDEIRNAS